MTNNITQEFKDEVRKQAAKQAAKWTLAAIAGLAVIAGTGWWFYFEEKIVDLAGGVPAGAVMAFDLSDGCPDGWTLHERSISRVIVGAVMNHSSTVQNLDINDNPLTARTHNQDGGEEKVRLTVPEMANHSHGPGSLKATKSGPHSHNRKGRALIEIGKAIGGASLPKGNTLTETSVMGDHTHDTFSGVTEKIGGGGPHNNMPPYIALYFCKKG